jgi:replicative DNA helicase
MPFLVYLVALVLGAIAWIDQRQASMRSQLESDGRHVFDEQLVRRMFVAYVQTMSGEDLI